MSLLMGVDNRLSVLPFESGKWTWVAEDDVPCQVGGTAHAKITVDFPLPEPAKDPIAVLNGRGDMVSTGSACTGGAFEQEIVRTGD